MVLNLGICLEDFAVEVLAYIFKFFSIQDRLKIACVCKRFKDVIDSTGEIWRTFNTDDELTVHQFDFIIVKHASHLNHVSLRFSQKCVRYNSPDLYIESALAMCKHIWTWATTLLLLFWTSLLQWNSSKLWFCYHVPALILSIWSNVSNIVRLLMF